MAFSQSVALGWYEGRRWRRWISLPITRTGDIHLA